MTNPDTMTPEELRVAVAEARGWTQIRTVNRVMMGVRPNETRTFQTVAILSPSKTLTAISLVPNFPTDANAALTLCDALGEKGWKFGCARHRSSGTWSVWFEMDEETSHSSINQSTLPVAICRVYLAVIQSQTPTT